VRQPAPETHPNGADRPGSAPDEAGRPARPLEIRLLGRVELAIDGAEVRLAARGAQALLAVLALKPRIRSREAVATEIWPDGDGSGNSASLRQALWLVRSSFQAAGVPLERYLTIDAEVIGLQPCAQVELDVARFEAALHGPAGGVEDAIALYQGDLTECLGLECFAVERERLSDAYEDALAVAAERRLAAGDPVGARELAEKLLGRDPLREEAHATLLWVHGRIGSRAQVIRQYRRLAALLRDELGVAPLPETEAVYQAALAQSVERSRLRATAIAFGEDGRGPTRVGRPGRDGGLVPTIANR
jgi:DNA-binding SARP family transcriptional activator